jgi:hypothetical protein
VCPPDCNFFLDKEETSILRANPIGPFSKPAIFDGGCVAEANGGLCVVPVGEDDVAVTTDFGTELVSYSRFKAPGALMGSSIAIPWLENSGHLFLAIRTARTLEFDGGLISTPASVGHTTVLRMEADAGLGWVRSWPVAFPDGGVLNLVPSQLFKPADAGLVLVGNCIRSTGVCDNATPHFALELDPNDGGTIILRGAVAPSNPSQTFLRATNDRRPWTTTTTSESLYFFDEGAAFTPSVSIPNLGISSCIEDSEDLVCLVVLRPGPIPVVPGCVFWTPTSASPAPLGAALVRLSRDGSTCQMMHEFRTVASLPSRALPRGSIIRQQRDLLFPVFLENAQVDGVGPVLTELSVVRVSPSGLTRHPLPLGAITDLQTLRNGVSLSMSPGGSPSLQYQGVTIPADSWVFFVLSPTLQVLRSYRFEPSHNNRVMASAANGRIAFATIGNDLRLNGDRLTSDGEEYIHVFVIEEP